jgi:ankyrin repeat protein
MQNDAERFLRAVRDEQPAAAKAMLDAHPDIVEYSIHTAAAVADAARVAAFLRADRNAVTRATQPDGTEPIVYAVLADIKRALGVPEAACVETVRVLLDAGASANASVPLDDATQRIPILYFPSAANQVEVARLLLERGAQVNDGESVYHAAQHNHRDVLALLLHHGADLSGRHESVGNTPLYFLATHRESNPITPLVTLGMQWLLEHGADPNVPSYITPSHKGVPGLSELPLHRVVASGRDASIAKMLVDHGAQIDATRGDGRTAYAMAVRTGNVSAADYLASVGADTTRVSAIDRLLGACTRADEPAARAIIAEHPDLLETMSAEDRQALRFAIDDDREEAVSLMLSLGWPLTDEGEWGGTPLHLAAWHGKVHFVEQLLHHGAPVNARDSQYGSSPIAWAAHGSVNAPGDTPGARDADYVRIVHLLLDAGATRAESYNSWNESPESLATTPVAQAMRERGFAV